MASHTVTLIHDLGMNRITILSGITYIVVNIEGFVYTNPSQETVCFLKSDNIFHSYRSFLPLQMAIFKAQGEV